ncbi:amino acid transporter heavy chain SLC3A2-like [Tiliqua scincoides]|uniref:amino acid transporter heavy chain SLC3A2-like n=1 Tax=Tiliqua scincoides TaxID=71010 RepID=UPI0034630A60
MNKDPWVVRALPSSKPQLAQAGIRSAKHPESLAGWSAGFFSTSLEQVLCPKQQTMGKVTDMIISPVPSERLPLLCQAAPSTTYLSQEEVVQEASAAPWQGLRRALLCLLGGLFISMLAAAVVLLVTMPRLHSPLFWWQKSSFYHLQPADFPDSNSDGHGDLEGVRQQLGQLLALPIQALVLGSILETDNANLTRVCPAYGSLKELRELVDEGHQKGIRILLELPVWEEELDLVAKDNRTARPLWGALRFWQEQGVDGFMVVKDPAWHLDASSVSPRDVGTPSDHIGECKLVLGMRQFSLQSLWKEGCLVLKGVPIFFSVLLVWDQSEACNVSRQVPSRVILACEINLTAQALAQKVEGALRHPHGPWPSWMLPRRVPLMDDLEEILGVLLLTLPGVPLLQGGAGAPLLLDQEMAASRNDGHPLANLYHSLLALRAKSLALQGVSFAPLPLASCSEDTFVFFRPSSCSGVLVLLNLGARPCQLSLGHLGFPAHVKVLFSTHPEPQPEANLEQVQLAPHQAILLRVPGGYGQ